MKETPLPRLILAVVIGNAISSLMTIALVNGGPEPVLFITIVLGLLFWIVLKPSNQSK